MRIIAMDQEPALCFHQISEDLLQFIEESPTAFHAVASCAKLLQEHGYQRLAECAHWELQKGGRYFVTRNGSSIVAFRVPQVNYSGYRLFCSHTDSPTFKVKEEPELEADQKYTKLNVEKYGGMLMAPWFDRPLSLAGRVQIAVSGGIEQRLIRIDRDLLLIPSLAIHMNREANDGFHYNAQTDLCPVFGDKLAKGTFRSLIAHEAGVEEGQILGMDLFLYNRQRGTFLGGAEEFIGSPRLDDLQCLYGSLRGFVDADENGGNGFPVFCGFDNEETGSVSRQGAGSTFLRDILMRVNAALGRTEEEYHRLVAGSFLISADNAHAVHPNHPEKADPVNRPQMNHGIVIKYNANQKYTTDAKSAAVLQVLMSRADIPYQIFTNRSDMAGGSTLGNISNTQVSLQAVDIGLPQLAMHSPYEMAGVKDTAYLVRLAQAFYSADMEVTDEVIRI